MPINYPGSLDSAIHPGPGTYRDDPGFQLSQMVSLLWDAVVALQNKTGIGASTPGATAAVLRRTAAGASAGGQIQVGDLALGAGWVMLDRRVVSGGPLGAWDFVQIPQTYNGLMVRWRATSNAAGANVTAFNAQFSTNATGTPTPDTSATYYYANLASNNGAASANGQASQTSASVGFVGGALAANTQFQGSGDLLITDYRNAAGYKLYLARSFVWHTSTAAALFHHVTGGAWANAGAINQIRLFCPSSGILDNSIVELWAS
jgi:hypothetical protein